MLSALFVSACLVLSAASLGYLMPGSLSKDLTPSESIALRVLAGLGTLGLLLFLIGQFIWRPEIVWLIILFPIVLQAARTLSAVNARSLLRVDLGLVSHGKQIVLILPCLIVLGLHFISALAKPVGDIGNDAISYHLLGPVVWERTHQVAPVLDHSHTAFPANVEVLFGAGILLANDRVPGLIGVVFAALLLMQIGGITRYLGGGEKTAALAMLVAATMPMIIETTEIAFVDVPYAAFCLAAARLAFSALGLSNAIYAGLFAGLAAGTKYTGLINIGLVAAVLLLSPRIEWSLNSRWRYSLIFTAIALATCAPWYIRNWIQLGTPIYPPPAFLARFVHAKAFSNEAAIHFQNYILDRGKGYGRSLLSFILLPYNLTYRPAAFHGAGGMGLVPLAFVPVFAARHVLCRKWSSWLLWMGLFIIGWFLTQQEARFFIAVLALMASAGAIGAVHIWRKRWMLCRILSAGVVTLSIVYGFATDAFADQFKRRERIASVFSRSVAQQRDSAIPFRAAFQYLNESSEVGQVLVLDPSVPCFYLHQPYIKLLGPYLEEPVPGIRDVQAALKRASELNITHILDVRSGGAQFKVDAAHNPVLLVWDSPAARVFKVRDQSSPGTPRERHEPLHSGLL